MHSFSLFYFHFADEETLKGETASLRPHNSVYRVRLEPKTCLLRSQLRNRELVVQRAVNVSLNALTFISWKLGQDGGTAGLLTHPVFS